MTSTAREMIVRFKTSVVLVLLLLGALFLMPYQGYWLLLVAFAALFALEWSYLVQFPSGFHRRLFLAVTLLGIPFWAWLAPTWTCIVGCLFWLASLVYLVVHRENPSLKQSEWLLWLVGLFVMWPMFVALLKLYHLEHGSFWLMLLFSITAGSDVGGYCFGKLFGKRKLMPMISPGKTVAGLIGALTFSVCFAYIMLWFLGLNAPVLVIAVLAMVCSLLAILGDLSESFIKRVFGVKDSSHVLPGHGGLWDRFDSLAAVAPFYYLYLYWLNISA